MYCAAYEELWLRAAPSTSPPKNPASAGATVVALFRAEASKILVIVLQLWLILAIYRDVVMAAFFAAFVITVLLFAVALLVRD